MRSFRWIQPRCIYFGILAFTLVTSFVVFFIPSNLFYVRWFFGLIFVLFLPGFSLVKIIFGGYATRKHKHKSENLNVIELFAYSIAMSIFLDVIAVFILNLTSWRIQLESVFLFLTFFIVLFSTIGFFMNQSRESKPPHRMSE